MKKIIVAYSLLAALSSFTYTGNPDHGPLLTIDTSNANFGTIPNIGTTQRTFMLRNNGDASLHITAVRPGCGCTAAALKDSVLGPGESTALIIRFTENNHWPGTFQKEVAVVSNSRDEAEKKFWFYGRFIAATGSDTAHAHSFVRPGMKGKTFTVHAAH